MTEPLSEDDYPDDSIVSFPAFEIVDGEKISLNYIREKRLGQDFHNILNVETEMTDITGDE